MGNIGEGQREYEYEPWPDEIPAEEVPEPDKAPEEAPIEEPVPA
jgi:hypothetical protein